MYCGKGNGMVSVTSKKLSERGLWECLCGGKQTAISGDGADAKCDKCGLIENRYGEMITQDMYDRWVSTCTLAGAEQ